jgi:D-3-phosphoglycerate dehydrogenase
MPKQCFNSSELKKYIHKYDGVVCGDDEFNLEVLSKAKKLKVISKWGTGIDSIDHISAKKKGIKVYNVKDAFTGEVATYAISILLYLTRGLGEINISKTKKWTKYSGESLIGKNAGVVGHGRIGSKIAKYLKALGCNVFINDTKKSKKKLKNYLSFNSILTKCNYIFFAVNLNETSKKMFTFKHEKFLKNQPIIINIARGPVLDEGFVVHCLKKKLIKNVGLDVFEKEPINKKNKLLSFNNNFYSAHNAFNTAESVERTNARVIENLIKGLK